MSTDTWTAGTTGTGAYAEVNGINLYYERTGQGRPMILLHGGLGSGEMYAPILPTLTADHEVIAVDLQATAAPPTSTARSTDTCWPTTSGP